MRPEATSTTTPAAESVARADYCDRQAGRHEYRGIGRRDRPMSICRGSPAPVGSNSTPVRVRWRDRQRPPAVRRQFLRPSLPDLHRRRAVQWLTTTL